MSDYKDQCIEELASQLIDLEARLQNIEDDLTEALRLLSGFKLLAYAAATHCHELHCDNVMLQKRLDREREAELERERRGFSN